MSLGKWHHCQFKIVAANSQNIWDEINRVQGFLSALHLAVAALPAVHTRSFAANHQELGKRKRHLRHSGYILPAEIGKVCTPIHKIRLFKSASSTT